MQTIMMETQDGNQFFTTAVCGPAESFMLTGLAIVGAGAVLYGGLCGVAYVVNKAVEKGSEKWNQYMTDKKETETFVAYTPKPTE